MIVALPQVHAMRTRFTYEYYFTLYAIYQVRFFDAYTKFGEKK